MLASLLTDILPESPKLEPDSLTHDKLSPSPQPITPLSAPATIYTFPPRTDFPKLTSPSSQSLTKKHMRSHSVTSSPSLTPDMSTTKLPRRQVTPNSSAKSSPRFANGTLPTPTSLQRHPSHLGRRESDSGLSAMLRRQSVHRRPSVSTISSSNPADSLRHVGEGALDSSDSSEEGGDSGDGGDVSSGEDGEVARPSASPQPAPLPLPLITLSSSPFSQREIDDKHHRQREEVLSPSPNSSDTASSGVGSPVHRLKSPRRHPNRVKTRSRSSTLASLAIAAPPFRRPLVKQESHSSMRTVLAGNVSGRNEDRGHDAADSRHTRQVSLQTIPPGILLSPDVPRHSKDNTTQQTRPISDRRPDIVRADEKRYRELSWRLFREQLEIFASEVAQFIEFAV